MQPVGTDHRVVEPDLAALGTQHVEWPVGHREEVVVPGAEPAQGAGPHHPGAGREGVAVPDRAAGEHPWLARRSPTLLRLSLWPADHGVVEPGGGARMRVEQRGLLFELPG